MHTIRPIAVAIFAASVVMLTADNSRTLCAEEGAWEHHESFTPIPLVPDLVANTDSYRLELITGLTKTIFDTGSAQVFPISMPAGIFTEPDCNNPAPILLTVMFGEKAVEDVEKAWEQHVVLTPIPLLPDLDSRTDSHWLRSITGIPAAVFGVDLPSGFPISDPANVPRHPFFSRKLHGILPAPNLLKVLFSNGNSSNLDEWSHAWDEPPDGDEFSPLKLAFPVVVDRAAPEPLVSVVTIEPINEWSKFRSILPHNVIPVLPQDFGDVSFDPVVLRDGHTPRWADRFRKFTLAVAIPEQRHFWPITVRSGSFVPFEEIEVDLAKIDAGEFEPASHDTLQESLFRPLSIDEWIGRDKPDKKDCFRSAGVCIER